MKLKVQQVMDSTLVISQIIREQRPFPQKGLYRLARMHAKLLPEFTTINNQRDEMIKAYNCHSTVTKTAEDGTVTVEETANFQVPPDKMEEFTAAWKKIGDEEIDVEIEPIPLSYLDMGPTEIGSISASELITLCDLIKE